MEDKTVNQINRLIIMNKSLLIKTALETLTSLCPPTQIYYAIKLAQFQPVSHHAISALNLPSPVSKNTVRTSLTFPFWDLLRCCQDLINSTVLKENKKDFLMRFRQVDAQKFWYSRLYQHPFKTILLLEWRLLIYKTSWLCSGASLRKFYPNIRVRQVLRWISTISLQAAKW